MSTHYRSSRTSIGFTLIEMVVVSAIILVLSSIVIASINKLSHRTMSVACLNKMRAIGSALWTYTSSWKGWTSRNAHAYPVMMGYPAYDPNDPGGFDELAAGRVEDFRCPIEQETDVGTVTGTGGMISKGYRRSYNLTSPFVGKNILAYANSDTVMLSETNKPRHPNGIKLGLHYLHADLSAKVSGGTVSDPEYMPGLMTNWISNVWLGSHIEWDGLPELVMVWAEPLARSPRQGLYFLPTVEPNWDAVESSGKPDMVLGIWTGFLDFPAPGTWTIKMSCDEVGGIWIDENGDATYANDEFIQQGTSQPTDDTDGENWWIRPRVATYNLSEAGLRHVYIYFFDWRDGQHFKFTWANAAAGIDEQTIPYERMWHNPFGNEVKFNGRLDFQAQDTEAN